MSAAPSAEVPLEVLQKLATAAEQMGIQLPGVARFAPTIDATMDIRPLSLELGRLVSQRNIFMHAGAIVTIDEKTGATEKMTSDRFPSWVEEFCKFIAPNTRRTRNSIPAGDASQILAADLFRSNLRPLTAINLMSLPVLRDDGAIEFLEPGYDERSQIFTVESIEYDMRWPLEKAIAFLNENGIGYPWSWSDGIPEEQRTLMENRSWAVHVAAMVGAYCRSMFKPGTPAPMILYIANQAGSGKSTLVSMVWNPIFGFTATTKTPKDDDKMDSELETVARSYAPYVFFDDIGKGLFSNPLNRFITSQYHSGRCMGGNSEMFMVPAMTQVFATGNDIKLSRDLMRRCLVAELFLAGEVANRNFTKFITPQYLSRKEVRQSFLSALCSLVKNFVDTAKRLNLPPGTPYIPRPIASFEEWTNMVGGIVVAAGYVDPTIEPDLSAGGSEDEDELRELLIRLASEATGDTEFDRKDLVDKAREFQLLESLLGATGDKEIDSSTSKKLGRQLQKWRGRELVDKLGRKFRFAHQRKSKGTKYPLSFITAPQAPR